MVRSLLTLILLLVFAGCNQNEPATAVDAPVATPQSRTAASPAEEEELTSPEETRPAEKEESVALEIRYQGLLSAANKGSMVRESAYLELRASHDEFLPLILSHAKDESQPEAERAFGVLALAGFYGDAWPPVRDSVAQLYQNEQLPVSVRAAAACVYAENDDEDQPVIDLMLAGAELKNCIAVREACLLQLDGRTEKRVLPMLCEIVKSDDAELSTKQFALEMIGKLNADAATAVPAILPLLDNIIPSLDNLETDLVGRAAMTLGEIGAPAAPAIPALMRVVNTREAGSLARQDALIALGQIAAAREEDPTEIVDFVIRMMEDKIIEHWAASALGEIGPRAAKGVPQLAALLSSEEILTSQFAATALGDIGPSAAVAVPELLKAVADKECKARAEAVEALGKIVASPEQVIPQLTALLAEGDLRDRALAAIEAYGPEGKLAVPAMLKQLNFGNEYDQARIIRVFGAIGPGASDAVGPLLKILETESPNTVRYTPILQALNAIAPDDPRVRKVTPADFDSTNVMP